MVQREKALSLSRVQTFPPTPNPLDPPCVAQPERRGGRPLVWEAYDCVISCALSDEVDPSGRFHSAETSSPSRGGLDDERGGLGVGGRDGDVNSHQSSFFFLVFNITTLSLLQ